MIQDIMPKLYHNEYIPEKPQPEDTVFLFHEGKILAQVDGEGRICFPSVKQVASGKGGDQSSRLLQYLFRIDERCFYLFTGTLPERIQVTHDEDSANPEMDIPRAAEETKKRSEGEFTESALESFEFHPLRMIRTARPKDVCFAAMTAWHLFVWYRDNRFCGRCGQPVVHDTKERMLKCPACGNQIYPRISPAVIVGVTDKNRIMMTRYAGREYKGNALIAGFCEIGETVEDTVRREVMEEVGLHVKNIRYYKSQPWGFSGDLLMGFFCEVDGTRSVHMDEQELAMAQWVDRRDIGEEPVNLSLTADMIMHFKHEMFFDNEMLPDYIRSVWMNHMPGIPEKKGTSAVVIPLIQKNGEYHILYEQRASGLKHQPGEICFPGGRVELGESPREAAIRETTEELLVDADQIELLAELDAQIGPSGAPIWPFVAVIHDYQDTFSEDEVGRVFTVPLAWFRDHQPKRHMTELVTTPKADFPYDLIPGGKKYPFRKKEHEMLFFQTSEAVIWGVTARITDYFVKEILYYPGFDGKQTKE